MSEGSDELKAKIRQLNARATKLKMDLHDLCEELPIDWNRIPELARQTHETYARLDEARRKLAAMTA